MESKKSEVMAKENESKTNSLLSLVLLLKMKKLRTRKVRVFSISQSKTHLIKDISLNILDSLYSFWRLMSLNLRVVELTWPMPT